MQTKNAVAHPLWGSRPSDLLLERPATVHIGCGEDWRRDGTPNFSGPHARVPDVGERVRVGFGNPVTGSVRGYFLERGEVDDALLFLGCAIELDDEPGRLIGAYGAELWPLEPLPTIEPAELAKELVRELERTQLWIAKVAADHSGDESTGVAAQARRALNRAEAMIVRAKAALA